MFYLKLKCVEMKGCKGMQEVEEGEGRKDERKKSKILQKDRELSVG